MSATVRPPAVAGLFYPQDPAELAADVDAYLAAAPTAPQPCALIAPHAGYVYSGPCAGTVYASLRGATGFGRVVLIGPSHRVGYDGVALSSAAAYRTPLGDLPIDVAAQQRLDGLPGVQWLDAAHRDEHCLEVQLPFLQRTLGALPIVPLVVGHADAATVAAVLEALWEGPETLVVISSDLSHYHDYATAVRRDAATAAAIEALDYEALSMHDACGRNPIRGLLRVARQRGLRVQRAALCNSGDTAGDRDRVVGYGGFLLYAQ